ncbi:MAG: Uncharacterized protein CEN87_390 [Parcubacteria group bacterium Licking1014_1]|nr:MAG: Uncharacterized protein CEN87_390 [Parcubacteria group bacterium Licking1014_1]
MKMKKTFIYLSALISLLPLLNMALAAKPIVIANPLLGVNSISELLTKIFTAVAGLVGILSVIMLIIAGILFVTSAGNPERVGSAKKAFFYAIIGIIVALAATAISSTILYIIGAKK